METSALIFSQPVWFWALAAVPVFVGLYLWSTKRSADLVGKIVAPRLRNQLAGAVSVWRRVLRAIFVLTAFALIVVGLAKPQWGFSEKEVKQRGRDVIIAVDTSRSMLATDVTPTRLLRAKLIAQDLLRLVRGDRVGLIAFAGSAFLQAPLTLDYNAVLTSLDELDTNVIPKGGTNIAAAIRAAEEAFGKAEGKTRALVILTDGEELDADGIAAAKKAAEQGIRIFAVGIGSGEGSLIPIRGQDGGNDFVRDASGKPVQSRLDETRLTEIAAAGGGFYENLNQDVAKTIFEKGIKPVDMVETGVMSSRQPIERYQWPVGAAILLLALWMLIGEKKRALFLRRGAATLALFLLPLISAQAATGVEDYQKGNYDKAMSDFEQRLKTAPDSDKLHFNAGASAYKLGDFGKSVDYFTKALLSEDRHIREEASYNLGNALVRRGEAAKGKDEKKADWKNAIQHYTEALNLNSKNKQAEDNREIVKKLLEDLEKEEKKQDEQKKDDQQKDQQKQDQKKDQQDQQKQDQQKNDQQKDQKQDEKKDQQDQQDKQDQQGDNQQKQDKQQQDQQKNDQQKDQKQDEKKDPQENKQDQAGQQPKDEEKKPEEKNPEKGGKDEEKKDQPEKPDDNKGEQPKDQNGQPQQDKPKDDKQGQGQEPTPQPTPGEKKQGELKANQDEPQPQGEGQSAAEGEAPEKEGEMSAAQAEGLLNSLSSEEERVKLMKRRSDDTLKDW